MLHVEKESGAEISPFQPNMVAMSVLKNSLNPATSNPALVSCKLIFFGSEYPGNKTYSKTVLVEGYPSKKCVAC